MTLGRVSTGRFVAATCRKSFYEFFLEFWSTIAAERLQRSWYIRKLCDELQVLSERVFLDRPKEYDLIWNCPPGTSKSSVLSVLWQPWVWTRMPSARFITGSYSERLALDLSRKSRDVIVSDKYRELFPEIKLRDDQNTKSYFVNTKGGMRYATGVGGSVIGMHAHFIGIDDPIDPQGVLSDLILEEANVWMTETLSRRKVDVMLTPTALIMQRLHQADPTGLYLERGTPVKHFKIPCDTSWDIQPPDLRNFYVDSLLDPARLPKEALEEAYLTLGESSYAGQYGQNPVPKGGSMFKVDRLLYQENPPSSWKKPPIRYWDKACLVSGTVVETIHGPKPIECMDSNDFVLTRDGYRRVLWAGETKRVRELVSVLFSDGSVLTGTPDHLVWTEDSGWVPLEDACFSNYNVSINNMETWLCGEAQSENPTLKFSPSMAWNIHADLAAGTSRHGDGTVWPGAITTKPSIKQFGSSTGAASPLVMMFTTVTGTLATTSLITLNAHRTAIICDSIGGNGRLTNVERWLAECLRGQGLLLGDESCARTVENKQTPCLPGNLSASCVNVPTRARRLTHGPVIALTSAGRSLKDGVPVYDISVEGTHEFFANGILVHNSTAGGGAFTVGTKMAMDNTDHAWVLDVRRGQWDTGTREDMIVSQAEADGKSVRQIVEEEPGSGGKHSAEATVRRLTLKGYRASAIRPSGDKELRADPFSQYVNLGMVILLVAPWNRIFVEELRFFPRSRYKDQVDSSSGGFSWLTRKAMRIGAL